MSKWAPVEVSLSGMDFAIVEARAIKRVKGLGAEGQAGIVSANIMGLLGELAVLDLLKRRLPNLLVSDVADDSSTTYDLEISTADNFANRLGIEIKTTSFANLYRRGRVIGMTQFESTDARAYVWCTTAAAPEQDTLFIMGWLPRAGMWDYISEPPAFHPRHGTSPPTVSPYRPAQAEAWRRNYDYDEDDVGYDGYGRDELGPSHDPEDRENLWSTSNEAAHSQEATVLSDHDALVKLQSVDHFWKEGTGDTSWRDHNQVKVVGAMRDMGDFSDWVVSELRNPS